MEITCSSTCAIGYASGAVGGGCGSDQKVGRWVVDVGVLWVISLRPVLVQLKCSCGRGNQ